ncbi:extracellular solute-binding protein [Dictyoglomus thermophilum]|uniref:ABC transporter substrate-binding protein n=1 Tax=Dictyoglomus thermophilum TaxID=14 RepID=UPI0011EAB429|nr:extracellular solute-binding protein [Dictyoglomus thermophilum]TYT24355.1 extracellular solute-binding protein [Dictyoglomus thermophilum]
MKMGRSKVLFLVLFMILCVTLIQGASPTTIRIGYGGPTTTRDYMKEVLKDAESALPGIKIEEVAYPTYEDMLALLPSQIAAGSAPDIVWWTAGDVTDYFSSGSVEPLDTKALSSAGIDLKEYVPSAIKAFTVNGKLYGVPLQVQSSAFVINQELLEKAGIKKLPETMNDVLNYSCQIKDKTGKAGLVLHLQVFHITHYVKAFGGGWNYGKTINSAANRRALTFLADLFTKYKVAVTPKDFGCAWDGEVFARGEAAMSTGGTWYIGSMREAAPKLRYKLIGVPTTTKGKNFVLVDSGGWSVLNTCKNMEAAVKVLAFLSSDKAQKLLYTTPLLYIPSKAKFIDDYAKYVPEFASLKDLLPKGINFDYPQDIKKFNDDLIAGFEQLIYKPGSITVDQLLSSLQKKYGQ